MSLPQSSESPIAWPGTPNADDPHGPQCDLPMPAAASLAAGAWCPLPDYGLLEVGGADRLAFLQGQLTNDLESMGGGAARWNGYCSPKGRLLSVFLCWQADDAVWLTVSRAQAEPLRKRLAMFVLRSKAVITDRSAQRVAVGLLGADLSTLLARLAPALPQELAPPLASEPMAQVSGGGCTLVRLAPIDGGEGVDTLQRAMLWMPVERLATVRESLGATTTAPTALWRWAEIRSAVPRVFAGTAEHFVPQMVNLELVGGVSFTKGCYPGQEVVARSQYLGKLKRRMAIGHAALGAAPGTEVSAAGRVAGEIVMSAASPSGGFDCLFECQTDALGDPLQVSGTPLTVLPLPYPIPEAVPVRRKL